MTETTQPIPIPDSPTPWMDAIGKAAVDAVQYGAGIMLMDSNMNLRHVPVEEYWDLCQFLEHQAAEQKPTSG